MYKAARSIAGITAALQPDLNMVLEWVIRNKLVMNVLKTKCMVFGSPRKLALLPSNSLNLVIGTDSIEQVKETVLLGLHMDQSLTWNLHTNHVVAKQSKNIALLRRHAWAMSHEICKMVVCALVLSVAQYCLPVLANMSESNTGKLQVAQNRACRLILKCSLDTPVKHMHSDLGWLTIRERFATSTLNMFFRILASHELKNIYSSIVPVHSTHKYSTRLSNSCSFKLPKAKTNSKKQTFLYRHELAAILFLKIHEVTRSLIGQWDGMLMKGRPLLV